MRTMADAKLKNLMIRACSNYSVVQQPQSESVIDRAAYHRTPIPDLMIDDTHIRHVAGEVVALIEQKEQLVTVLMLARKTIEADRSSLFESSKDPKTNQVTCEIALAGLAEYAIVLNKIDKITRGEI